MNVLATFVLTGFVWWFATGAILFFDGLPRRTFKWTIGATTALTGAAFAALVASAWETGAAAAWIAFVGAIIVWGWNEVAFLMGGVTGPRRSPCPSDATGWRRFGLAFQTLLYHEALIAACGLLIAVVSWNAPNKIALWTYLILWAMRASAKLNIFLGVPNITHEFLPAHLSFLKSYFRFSSGNALLPVSIAAGALLTVFLAAAARGAPDAGFKETGFALLASLTALAVLEHIFMIVPLPSGALWAWAMRTHDPLPASIPLMSDTRTVTRAGGDR